MYYALTESFKEQEKILVDMILKIAPVEQIYILGSTLNQRRTESIFMTGAPSCRKVGHYYLLVLAGREMKYSYNDLQDRIENTSRSFIPVTAIVLGIEEFSKWVYEGHRFAQTVINAAVLLYGNDNSKSTGKSAGAAGQKENSADYWTGEYNRVNEFIAGATLFILRQQNKMAIFMLHQATEHALRSIFKKASGLHINTHNLDKLVRYCSILSYQIPDIFNRNNDKEERLFQLLQKAYIDTRYKQDFVVSKNDLEIILEKIKTLLKIMQDARLNAGFKTE